MDWLRNFTMSILKSVIMNFYETLVSRVIDKQSIQVDGISGATITSNTFLKAVENALQEAAD